MDPSQNSTTWLEFRSGDEGSAGLYTMYGMRASTSTETGHILTEDFNKIPIVPASGSSQSNPKIYFTNVTLPARASTVTKNFDDIVITPDINKVATILAYGKQKTYDVTIDNDEKSFTLNCSGTFSTATTVDLMIVYY